MLIGLVKWFEETKGFGVITTPDEGEIFFHISSFNKKPLNISVETAIIFSKKLDVAKNRYTAENCRLVDNLKDFKIILSYLNKPSIVNVEVVVKRRGLRGNSFYKREIQSVNLMVLFITKLFKDKNEDEFTKTVIDYYNEELEKKYFISYCELIENLLLNYIFKEKSSIILKNIYTYFGDNQNEEMLYELWKTKKFKFISYVENKDYEIPENILRINILELTTNELMRIRKYSYSDSFFNYFEEIKFKNLEIYSYEELKKLYDFLEFINQKDNIKLKLDSLYAKKIETQLTKQAIKLNYIENNEEYKKYIKIINEIPTHLNELSKNKIKESINNIILSKCSEEYIAELWFNGFIEDISFETISLTFLHNETLDKKRIDILSKLNTNEQLELLKRTATIFSYEYSFILIEELIKKTNELRWFTIAEVNMNSIILKNKPGYDLIKKYCNYIENKINDEQRYDLFLKGFINDIPQKTIEKNINNLEQKDLYRVLKSQLDNKKKIKKILELKISASNPTSYIWIYILANEFLDNDIFNQFDNKVYQKIEDIEYFKIWKTGNAKILPENYIDEILNEDFNNYKQIQNWIDKKTTTTDEINKYLFAYLSENVAATDRLIFCKQINHIQYLLKIDISNYEKIRNLKNNIYILVLWFLDYDERLNFEVLKKKFIYFKPDEQVKILRKLFLLKVRGEFDLTIEKLNDLTRFDLDLFKTSTEFNPDISIDISTDVVIKSLLHYKENGRFYLKHELSTIIFNDLIQSNASKFKFHSYFENCLGREIAEYEWSKNGEVTKVEFGNNQFYFAIKFDYDSNLVEAVKRIPYRKWNNDTKVWIVPSKYEKEVLEFATTHRFFVKFEGSNYANNTHLANFKRVDPPNGIIFCEGRLANIPHKTFNKKFWWCSGQPCFNKCETIHTSDKWENYTLLDFCEILGLNTDEINKMGDKIPHGHYYQFVALINRFSRLFDKLNCLDCNQILYPADFGTSHFAAHTIVRYQCRNVKCSNKEEIYLNHCLNGQCNNIIDSRVSKKCKNGLFICDKCGSCCSHEMFKRRLNNLELNGGKIPHNLIKCVDEKLGHLERGDYYCYKCEAEMVEVVEDIYNCINCNPTVQYNTSCYNLKRPHKYLKEKGTMNLNQSDSDDSWDFPF
jgi:hypothetical protein